MDASVRSHSSGMEMDTPSPTGRDSAVTESSSSHGTSIATREDGQQQQQPLAPLKPKQKRNKPTLSCSECVQHKTKCDRGRPCINCVKRSTPCVYTAIADILAAAEDRKLKSRRTSKASTEDASSRLSIANLTYPSLDSASPPQSMSSCAAQTPRHMPKPQEQTWVHLSSLPESAPAPLSVFGMGSSHHPFSNYWTAKGGLAEVISVLPSKEQADIWISRPFLSVALEKKSQLVHSTVILVARYFETVDAVYPIVERQAFLAEYEHFWNLSFDGKSNYPAAVVALHFVIYAIATQHISIPSASEKMRTAEFYISAAHQAIRISSYLTCMTIPTVQSMIFFFYYLTNDNHVSDAWTFSGITQRQAYVLQLNREPDLIVPNATVAEKNLRCKLWALMIFQETAIAMFLKLPSTATHCDVGPHSLNYDEADKTNAFHEALSNGTNPIPSLCLESIKTDISYVKSIWAYAIFIQENICRPRAIGQPICQSNDHKRELLSSFRSLYRSFPQPFGSYDPKRFQDPSRRVVRQQIALSQSFFHSLMLICADENVRADVPSDLYGTLEAAHEALSAFFAMRAVFGEDTDSWWSYQHRAFEQAMLVANLLAKDQKPLSSPELSNGIPREFTILTTAKNDVQRMIEIIEHSKGYFAYLHVEEPRLKTLRDIYDRITII